jgi:hypothetical protein
LGGSPEGQGHLRPVSGGLEGENPVSEADTEPPVAGFGAWRGCAVLGLTVRHATS